MSAGKGNGMIQVIRKAVHFAQRPGDEPYVILKGIQIPLSQLTDEQWNRALLDGGKDPKEAQFYPKPTVGAYYSSKAQILLADIMLTLFFLVIAVVSYASAFSEATSGEVPHIMTNDTGLTVIGAITTVLGFVLLMFYTKAGLSFAKHGEEQLDDLLSNIMGLATMLCIGVSLIFIWVAGRPEDSLHQMGFRRTCYIYFVIQGIIALYTMTRTISRHWAVERIASSEQYWMQPVKVSTGGHCSKDSESFFYKHFVKSQGGAKTLCTIMLFHTLAVIGTSSWLLAEGLIRDKMPDFTTMYYVYMILMGIFCVVLVFAWSYWWLSSQDLDCIFRTHYDAYHIGSLALPLAVIFLLLGYRHVYQGVIPGPTLPIAALETLKYGYWMKTITAILLLFPQFSMGLAKGLCLWTNLFPLAGTLAWKIGHTDSHGFSPSSLDCQGEGDNERAPLLV